MVKNGTFHVIRELINLPALNYWYCLWKSRQFEIAIKVRNEDAVFQIDTFGILRFVSHSGLKFEMTNIYLLSSTFHVYEFRPGLF